MFDFDIIVRYFANMIVHSFNTHTRQGGHLPSLKNLLLKIFINHEISSLCILHMSHALAKLKFINYISIWINCYVSNNSEICKKKEESLPIYLTFQSLSGPHTMQFMDMYNTFVFRKRLWKKSFFTMIWCWPSKHS